MSALRLVLSLCTLVALSACQSVRPVTEPSALELDESATAVSYAAASGSCMNGSVKVCAKEFSAEPFTCGCLDEMQVRPLWNR